MKNYAYRFECRNITFETISTFNKGDSALACTYDKLFII